MLRLDCLRAVYSDLEPCLVVTIMGATAAELHALGHRANFFYLQLGRSLFVCDASSGKVFLLMTVR